MITNKLNQEVEQPIDPPEHAEWSQRDIDSAIAKLVEQIEDGADWDEDGSYKLDMANEIINYYYSDLDIEDARFEIEQSIEKYVFHWATDAVTCNPDKYCEVISPNDDL